MTHRASIPALALLACLGCDIQRGAETADAEPAPPARERSRRSAPAREQPPPPMKRTLPGERAAPAALDVATLERIDLAAGLTSGEITIEVDDPAAQPAIGALIDGDTESLLKTDAINPLVVNLTLAQPARLRAVRVYLAASAYDWVVEPLPGQARLLATAAERQWSQIDLPEPTETDVIRLEFLRLERDDYVHVNEIELYAE